MVEQTLVDKKQYPIIDLLKYICALLVVTIHIAPLSSYFDTYPITKYMNFGIQQYIARIAVPFYFAAAGFFLFRKIDVVKFDISVYQNYAFKLLRLLGVWSILLFVGSKVQLWYMGGGNCCCMYHRCVDVQKSVIAPNDTYCRNIIYYWFTW